MKTTQNNIRVLLLQCIGLILSGCTIYGYAPIGIGYFSALYATGQFRVLTLITTTLGLFYSVDYVDFVKYFMVMLIVAGISALYEGSRKEKLSIYKNGLLVMLSTGLLELTDAYMSFSADMNTYIVVAGVCVLAGAIMIVFSRGIEGILNSSNDRIIQSEEMIGISVICGICFYFFVTNVNVPYSIVETVTFFMMLYFPYKYGAGMGAIAGVGFGIAMGLETNKVEIVSIMCVAAIAVGGMRELGRIASSVALMCTVVSGSLLFAPDILNETSIQGMLAGVIIFLILPNVLVYRDKYEQEIHREGNNEAEKLSMMVGEKLHTLCSAIDILYESLQDDIFDTIQGDKSVQIRKIVNDVCGECAKCGKCKDKLRVMKGFSDKGRPDIEDKGNCPYIYKIENEIRFMEERRRSDDIWKNRVNHIRENVNIQLEELSSLVSEYSGNVENSKQIKNKDNKLFGKLYRKLRSRFITLLELQIRENESGSVELDITVKCDTGKAVTIKEISNIISEVMGQRMEPDKNDSLVIGESYKTLFFRQAENFALTCGVAKSVKNGGKISGDNQSVVDIGGGKWLITLADGMGSGEKAYKESENVTDLLGNMLKSGFSRESAVKLVNSISSMNWKKECTTSVDMGVVDMYSGVCNFLKMGGASTFIKRKSWVDVMKSTSLPVGIVDKADIDSATKKLYAGDKIVLVSDGVLEGIDSDNAELEISRLLLENSEDTPSELADKILGRAMEDSYYVPSDDMTVVVAALSENLKSA